MEPCTGCRETYVGLFIISIKSLPYLVKSSGCFLLILSILLSFIYIGVPSLMSSSNRYITLPVIFAISRFWKLLILQEKNKLFFFFYFSHLGNIVMN